MLVLIGVASSGCGMLADASSPRSLGERFTDSLETRSDVPFETYMTPDADVYLQGGTHLSLQAFREYVDRMRAGHQFYQRMSRVYATRGGAGWLLGITRTQPVANAAEAQTGSATLWMEVTIQSGQITRLWMHFTLETLQSIRQSPYAYEVSMAAEGLPLPDSWLDGTAAMVQAAEALDAQMGGARSEWEVGPGSGAPLIPLAAGLLGLRMLLVRRTRRDALDGATWGGRNSALLVSVRERRERAAALHPNTGVESAGAIGVADKD
jgi:hypothetical protein